MAMCGTQRPGESRLSCLGHRPPPLNLHFIMVTSIVRPFGLTPSLTTKAVSCNIWDYWHSKELLSVLGDCQLWDVSAGGRQLPAKPSGGASVVGTGVAASPGPWSPDTETPVLPRGPPLFGHRWEWEAEHIVEISGDWPPFALGR